MAFGGISLALLALAGAMPVQKPAPQKADSILILKKDHLMELLARGKVIRAYKVALGQGGLAPKVRQGDGRTPEGHYIIDAKYANSEYHKALHISYPNAEDRKRAAKLGVSAGRVDSDSRPAQRQRLYWRGAPALRLDAGLHRRHRRGDRRDLESGSGGHAGGDQAIERLYHSPKGDKDIRFQ